VGDDARLQRRGPLGHGDQPRHVRAFLGQLLFQGRRRAVFTDDAGD